MAQTQKNQLLNQVYYSLGVLRAVNYTAQGVLLPLIDQFVTQQKKKPFAEFKEHIKEALPKIEKILRLDADNISAGHYPAEVLFQESPLTHFPRIPFLFADAYRAAQQKLTQKSDLFETQDSDFVNEAPEYFRRNFHFQKGGYLNDDSAKLYDHQVEVLFSGTARAMRRQIIPQMKKHLNSPDGEGLKFLEVGSGTGSLTRDMALAFPKAQIVSLDISPHYLNFAQKRLAPFKRINYIQGQGESLNFKDEVFDAVYSCYLFHELPEKIRRQTIAEKIRVLKTNGYLGIVDSIQNDDDVELNWALKQFPLDFHEPFFKNYVQTHLEGLLKRDDLLNISTDIAFLTKIVSAVKKS